MAEQDVFTDQNVKITTARVIIGGTTYALRNITSVKSTYTPAKRGCAITLLVFGVFSVFSAFAGFSHDIRSGLSALVFAAIMIGLAVLWMRASKDDYHVAITTAAGEAHALTSKDRMYIDEIVSHINDAMVGHE